MTHGIAGECAENSDPARPDAAMPLTRPESIAPRSLAAPTIPGYEILEEIGRGGMGVVYKAHQTSLQRFVALKVVIGGAFAGPVERARFRMEAEALARLRHPNVVQVYDVGEHDGVAYIAFEFVDGTTLRRWQAGDPIEPPLAARFTSAIARAIQHAHEMGIVHRDLKPANILLQTSRIQRPAPSSSSSSFPTPKVSDFGLAKPIESAAALTLSGVTCGTPNYMAPEQVRGGRGASLPPVDVWGLGAILFELLTGRPPFDGPDATAIMQEIALSDPPSLRSIAPGLPRDLGVIVGKCLEKNPASRYVSAGEMADDLDRFLAGEPILARPIGAFTAARRWIRRNPIATLIGLFLLIALAGVSAAAAALSSSASRERAARQGEHAALLEEARLRKKADEAKTDAEKARDETHAVLLRVEQALRQAGAEKERAERNLAIARQAVKHVLSTTANLTEADDPALFPVYRNLLAGLAPFAAEIIAQKNGDPDLKYDQAEMSRALGVLESLQGRPTVSRDHFLAAVARLRELVREEPTNPRYQLDLARALGFAASVGVEIQASDTKKDFAEARAILDQYLSVRPDDVEGLNEMIRVRLSMIAFPGSNDYTDEHDRVVLDLIDRLVSLRGASPQLRKLRAHALNNIASDLTNRGKTDEAESMWLDVLRMREELWKTLPGDRITRYELGKCLANYANQLAKTGRTEAAFRARERAAGIFDALYDDARNRTTYVQIMLDINLLLVNAYTERGQHDKVRERWTKVIALTSLILTRDRTPDVCGLHANAHTRRAELFENAGLHADAARDYKTASEFSTAPAHRDYCLTRQVLAVAHSGDRKGATALGLKLEPEKLTHPQPCVELARSWLVIAAAAEADGSLNSDTRKEAVDAALAKARSCIHAARKKGMYQDEKSIAEFRAQKEFEPVWDALPR